MTRAMRLSSRSLPSSLIRQQRASAAGSCLGCAADKQSGICRCLATCRNHTRSQRSRQSHTGSRPGGATRTGNLRGGARRTGAPTASGCRGGCCAAAASASAMETWQQPHECRCMSKLGTRHQGGQQQRATTLAYVPNAVQFAVDEASASCRCLLSWSLQTCSQCCRSCDC